MRLFVIAIVATLAVAAVTAWSQTQPTSRPSPSPQRAEKEMDRLLKPGAPTPKPLLPAPDGPTTDRTTGTQAVAPNAPVMNVLREGPPIIDRAGRLQRSADGQQMEFVFDSDGRAMRDPPVIILPNLKLMAIEDAVSRSSRDLRFKISGTVTEYRGRNYVLLDKVVVVPDVNQQF